MGSLVTCGGVLGLAFASPSVEDATDANRVSPWGNVPWGGGKVGSVAGRGPGAENINISSVYLRAI